MRTNWIVQLGHARLRRTWDGEAVIYDALSGSTYYLDSVAVAVLDRIGAGPTSAEEIARALRAELDADSEVGVLTAVQETLANLGQMDLIRPADF